MQAIDAYIAGMQYTLRNIPHAIYRALRDRAERDGTTLNEATIAALTQALGFGEAPIRYRTLGALAGTWQEDQEFDEAIEHQDTIDPSLWH